MKVGPSLGLLGTLIPMGSSLASLASGNLQAMAGQMVVAFTTTIVGLATGTLAYAVTVVRQNWVNESIREQRYLAERIAGELSAGRHRRSMARFLHLPARTSPSKKIRFRRRQPLRRVDRVHRRLDDHAVFDLPAGRSRRSQCEVTMVKTNAQGEREIIVKKGTTIQAYRVTGETTSGNGERLGTAYRLANGQIIYIPKAEDADVTTSLARRCSCAWWRLRLHQSPGGAADACPPGLSLFRRQHARNARGVQGSSARAAGAPDRTDPDVPDRIGGGRRQAGPALGADVLVFDVMNQQLLDGFNAKHSVDLVAAVKRKGPCWRSAKAYSRKTLHGSGRASGTIGLARTGRIRD